MLEFQLPGGLGGSLLDHLLTECTGALRGGGIFAWATVGGITRLFEEEAFEELLDTGDFKLIVGTDTITDTAAIARLLAISTAHPNLDARAFLNPTTSLFHPKLAWFEHDDYLSLVIGSGNLTRGGLLANWEAFVVQRLTDAASQSALAEIEGFIADQAPHLVLLNDQRVLDRVVKNTGDERSLRHVMPPPSTPDGLKKSVTEVLVADMNRTESRLAQANFKVKDYEEFFGAERGVQRVVSLQLVDPNGSASDPQLRRSVEAAGSRNYRFELDGLTAAHLSGSGRPIGVFLRLATGGFLYSLVRPQDAGFSQLDALLQARSTEPSSQLRRVRISADELAAAWPSAPLWRVAPPAL